MQTFQIVKASQQMCDTLAIVKRDVWETTYRGIYPADKFDNYDNIEHAKKFKQYIDASNIELYVAKVGDRIVGYMSVGKSAYRPAGELEIVTLYVLKQFQGVGIGKALFNFGKERIIAQGGTQFTICCNKYNLPAQEFYKKMGGRIICVDDDMDDRSIPQIQFQFNVNNGEV